MDGVSFDQKDLLYESFGNNGEKILDVPRIPSNLFGMTCDGRDVIASNCLVPDMEVGDWLIFGGMGAYTVGPKSQFNGMEAANKVEIWRGTMIE